MVERPRLIRIPIFQSGVIYMKHHIQSKKDKVLKPKNSINWLTIVVVAVALMATVAFAFYLTALPVPPPGLPAAAAVAGSVSTETVSFPVEQFVDGRAHFFDHRNKNITIRYFILKSADGVLRAAFDACDVCWPSGKGYEQQGDEMVCRNCNQRFASVLVNEVSGGCNPAPLGRSVQNDHVVLRISDIEQGSRYFDFGKGA